MSFDSFDGFDETGFALRSSENTEEVSSEEIVDMALASASLRSAAIWRQVSGIPMGEFIFLSVLGGPWTNLLLVARRAMGAECIVWCEVVDDV